MPSNELNREQVLSMQEDAMRRVREMHRRANERVRQTNQAIHSPASTGSPPPPTQTAGGSPSSGAGAGSPSPSGGTSSASSPPHPASSHPQGRSGQNGFSLPSLGDLPFFQSSGTHGMPYQFNPLTLVKQMNPETMILLALIVMLLNDGGDIKLILALCYLLF